MAIQMRRGNYADYDESKIRPGEWAVATDAERVFIGVASGAVEMAKKSDVDAMAETAEEAILDAKAKALATIYGSLPTTVSTVVQMVDHDLTYIYSGSETGYTAGHWYYWDGSAWADGGQYVDKSKTNSPIIYNTASGAIASFSDGADDYPIKGLTVAVEPIQSGSGDPSPSNVRPISGWSEVKVTRCGKNLLDSTFCTNRTQGGTTTVVNDDGSITLTGTASSATRYWASADRLNLRLPAGTYTLSDGVRITYISGGSVRYKSGTFTLNEEITFINAYFTLTSGTTYNTTFYPQLEVGSVATDYEKYNPTEYTISLGETVYGGTLDVVGGKMVVDRKAVDLGSLTWSAASTSYRFYASVSDAITPKAGGDVNAMCTSYRRVSYSNPTFADGEFCVSDINFSGSKRCLFKNNRFESAADFKTAVTGQTMVYTLAEPIEIPLTPTQISTLLGVNNVYSSAGNVEVEYPADTKQFILASIANALASV